MTQQPDTGTPPLHRSADVVLTGQSLTFEQVYSVARNFTPVILHKDVFERLAAARAVVEAALADGEAHYGINTGFGSLSRKRIAPQQLRDLQRNLVRSHSAGIGEHLDIPCVRAMMLLLCASLCRGRSGVRALTVSAIAAMLNAGITPVVPAIGSVGASGDLAPLAAVGVALIGEGECYVNGNRTSVAAALAEAGLAPIVLEAKEGLAIINGTHLMAGRAALLAVDLDRTFEAAIGACAMSIDACRATDQFLDARIHHARNQPGQIQVAAMLRHLLRSSEIIPSHRDGDPRVQDPYCLRCAPQVLGAALDTIRSFRAAITAELGAVTDNPLVFAPNTAGGPATHGLDGPDDSIVSGGNFHGMPLAIPLDYITIALVHIAGISERRTFWMISAFDAESHLTPYLAHDPGVNSGLMIAQYTAAACCNEIITLATPASISNISTSAGIEDYNSFGPRAAAKATRALELVNRVVAIELLAAAQGLESHRPLRSGPQVESLHARIRALVQPLLGDRPLTPDIESLSLAIARGDLRPTSLPNLHEISSA